MTRQSTLIPHSEYRGVKIYRNSVKFYECEHGVYTSFYATLVGIDEKLGEYKPKNNWVFEGKTNEFLTPAQFCELEKDLIFSGETIEIQKLYPNRITFDVHFTFKGLKFNCRKPYEDNHQDLDELIEEHFFEEVLIVFAEDTLNDAYENYEEYLKLGL